MAWSRIARETGAEYLVLKLDDPSFTAPVYASLVQSDQRRAQAHLVHRFQNSNHIKRRCRVYRTKYGRQDVG